MYFTKIAILRKSFLSIYIFLLCINLALSQAAFYPDNQELKNFVQQLEGSYPDIVKYNEIGYAENASDPIIALKISDNVTTTEDEPVWIFTGIIHGREKLGLRVLLNLANDLTSGYSSDPNIKNWVDAYEIWLVLNMNPYGYKNNVRKNGPDYSGVDLNRNWDFRWGQGGSADPSSSNFRGAYAESESETKTVSDLYRSRHPLFGITFHQGNDPDGGQIMRPWGSISPPPDAAALLKYSEMYADMVYNSRLEGGFCRSIGGGQFAIMDPDGSICGNDESRQVFCRELCWKPELATMGAYGQSSNWCYAEIGTIDLTVEISDRTFNEGFLHSTEGPSSYREEKVLEVVTEFAKNHTDAIKSWFQDFYGTSGSEKFRGTGITGKITNSATGGPVEATIKVQGFTSNYINDRKSEPEFGRYWRFLPAGEHNIEISAYGYSSWNGIVNVSSDGFLTELNVQLDPWATNTQFADKNKFVVYPNPVTENYITIDALNLDGISYNIRLANVQGTLIMQRNCNTKQVKLGLHNVPNGVYILTVQHNEAIESCKLLIMNEK